MKKSRFEESWAKRKAGQALFSSKERLKVSKVYIPRQLLKFMPHSEFIAVLKGIKPVATNITNYYNLNELLSGLEEAKKIYSIEYLVNSGKRILVNSDKNYFKAFSHPTGSRKEQIVFSISRSKELVERANEYYLKRSDRKESPSYCHKFGLLAGYPKCCVDFADHVSGFKGTENEEKGWRFSNIRKISFQNSKKFSRYLNIFSIESLVSHMPCHLNCKPSKKYARKLLSFIEEDNKLYADSIKYFLFETNSLFWDESNKILIDGVKEDNTIEYEEFWPLTLQAEKCYEMDFVPREKLKKTVSLMEKGNKLVMDYFSFSVYKGEKLIGTIKKDSVFEVLLY